MAENGKPEKGTSRLEEKLDKMELELQARYCEMGKNLLELADTEQRAIDRLLERIIQTRRQLAKAKREIQCPACLTYNTADSAFCRKCGEKLPPAPKETEKENTDGTE